jgi:hypothetical protein
MEKTCKISGKKFTITSDDLKFYEKMGVPVPTLCPEERQRRRLTWRHGGKLFKIKCAGSGKETFSMYSPQEPFPIYEQEYWWSDHWDGQDYAQEVDFEKNFFNQFETLAKKVPRISLVNTNSVNSYYTNHGLNLKNCYLVLGGTNSEDCFYSFFIQDCRNVVDGDSLLNCELCFSGNASIGCYQCSHITHFQHCSDCTLIHDCISCQDCVGCVGLRHKQYYIFNKPYSKQEYEKIKSSFSLDKNSSQQELSSKFEALKKEVTSPSSHTYNCEDCTGDMLFHCNNCKDCFDCKESEHCKYLNFSPNGLESYDACFTAPVGVQFSYENVSTLGNHMIGNALVWRGADVFYSLECHNSHDLFGCIGLKHAEYCILNKKYSKEEYEKLRDKIIEHMKKTGEWGEFFPIEIAPFAYNETIAMEYFPLSKKEVLARGWRWRSEEGKDHKPATIRTIPDDITDIPDSICQEVLACAICKKNYQIQKEELKFYRKMELPVPHKCPDCRHHERMHLRNPRTLHLRNCDKCSTEIQTTFAPERPEQVYCEKCYLAEVN